MKIVLFSFLSIFFAVGINAQVSIGTTSPHSSAILHLESTSKGLLLPRFTSATAAMSGMMRYNTANNCIEYFDFTWRCPQPGNTANTARVSSIVSSSISGTITQFINTSGITITLNYSQGNGGAYPATFITNLGASAGQISATLAAGNLVNGFGSITYNLNGVPSQSGPSFFVFNIGSEVFVVNFNINP